MKSIHIEAVDEELVDLLQVNDPRIKALSSISEYKNTYEGYSKVRLGVFHKLMEMLKVLPQDVGIAYFEGLRPLWKQKEYFDKKLKEILVEIKDKEMAYQETTKHVSPFIDNIPTHGTGAAIDITLFKFDETKCELMNMGMFDTIHGHNPQQETFSANTTQEQRENRLILLEAATKAGMLNYGFEWWHYSYGDKAWAYVEKKQSAIYDLAIAKDDPILSMDKKSYLESF